MGWTGKGDQFQGWAVRWAGQVKPLTEEPRALRKGDARSAGLGTRGAGMDITCSSSGRDLRASSTHLGMICRRSSGK
jgi:hypothetical protein